MQVGPEPSSHIVEHLFRHESGRLLASLTHILGVHQLAVAEEIVQETLLKALMVWPYHPPIENPVAWLSRVARHKAIDHLRRHQQHLKYLAHNPQDFPSLQPQDLTETSRNHPLGDELVQMLFVCCTQELASKDQVALCLQLIGGLSAKEIATAFLVSHESMRKRLYRAKQHLKKQGATFSLPADDMLSQRLDTVLAVLYLMFNEGYHSHSDHVLRRDLCHEAIRLVNLLLKHPRLKFSRVYALGALMHFQSARFNTRTDIDGQIQLLEHQDRSQWDAHAIKHGFQYMHLAKVSSREQPFNPRYHLEAGIAAYHCAAKHFDETNWQAILQLYQQLLAWHPNPIVQLNHHIVLGYVQGPEQAFTALKLLEQDSQLSNHYLLYSCLSEFAARSGENQQALDYLKIALKLAPGKAQQQLLKKKLTKLKN